MVRAQKRTHHGRRNLQRRSNRMRRGRHRCRCRRNRRTARRGRRRLRRRRSRGRRARPCRRSRKETSSRELRCSRRCTQGSLAGSSVVEQMLNAQLVQARAKSVDRDLRQADFDHPPAWAPRALWKSTEARAQVQMNVRTSRKDPDEEATGQTATKLCIILPREPAVRAAGASEAGEGPLRRRPLGDEHAFEAIKPRVLRAERAPASHSRRSGRRRGRGLQRLRRSARRALRARCSFGRKFGPKMRSKLNLNRPPNTLSINQNAHHHRSRNSLPLRL